MPAILVIEDDAVVRDALEVFLSRAGHRVLTAADGANGLLAFKNNPSDLVILDLDLPLMSGAGVLENIRKISSVPVIILSGYCPSEETEAYLSRGAASFLSKGDGLSNVMAEVERVLAVRPAVKPATGAADEQKESRNRKPGADSGLVLVVEDDEQLRDVLARHLSSQGYTVIEAANGITGAAVAKERAPDIVLLDIVMPGKSGVEVLKELAPVMPGTGFIMVTGNEDETIARFCLELGAFDYIAKPYSGRVCLDQF